MTYFAIWPILACFLASLVTCLLTILTQKWHGTLSLDHDLNGVQKLHETPVPRIGGISVIVGLLIGLFVSAQFDDQVFNLGWKLLLCSAPVFGAGFIEDLTKKVGVRTRLFAAFTAGAFAYYVIDAKLVHLDTPGLDYIMGFWMVSFLFTAFAVGGLTNAINIIDGLNGLASGSVAIMLGGLAAIAWNFGDHLVMNLCLFGAASALGFLLFNYPFGKIFLGDGGAYLAGFWLAECAILLMARNPEVNTWTVLLCVCYPVVETGYSMYRRHVIEKVSSGQPDSAHMHQLLFKRKQDNLPPWLCHGLTSGQIWLMVGLCQLLASLTLGSTVVHVIAIGVAAALYVAIHRTLWASLEPDENRDVVL